ncbi:sensor histidine kinase [Cohnella phaseoli]|uniref:histidine kinase n=1 Tax=Cohnella phaseoli TaxID=456490 RepID=A0A3D9JPN1_9BACL|nr:HAMP domain-containing sensor histidine kinase [Cohnella phaseoli]RED76071.1 signal transduction histidine kinase [Cohnella phaseoli]
MKILRPDSIAVKLGAIFILLFMVLIFAVQAVLYMLFIRFYTADVLNEQIQRTQRYAEVLSDHFDPPTIQHLLLVESGADHLMLILDQAGNSRGQSEGISDLPPQELQQITEHGSLDHGGPVLKSNWKNDPFFVTEASIVTKGQPLGRVLMFSTTDPIRSAAQTLKNTFFGVAFIVLFLGAAMILLVTRRIVQPLLRMIKITQQISQGKHVTTITAVGNDEIAQLSHAINRMSQNIEFYKQQRKQFLADISHELRTPITYMKGYSEVLIHELEGSKESRKKYLRLIYDQSHQLQHLIEDLFELAKLEEGTYSLDLSKTSLDKMMQNVLGMMADSIEQSGITLNYNPSLTPLFVQGDAKRLQQVVINVLDNAHKYSSIGGSITVSTLKEETFGLLIISDTGIGIPAEDLPHIWDRLYRVDRSRSRATGGTGIGLSICKEIVTLHQGSIQAESTEGQGTTFSIRIPLFEDTTEKNQTDADCK